MAQYAVPLHPQDNRLLSRLPRKVIERLLPHLELVTLACGAVLYEPGQAPAYLYFPTTALVSLVYTTVDGTTAEIGLVGNEGVLGVAAVEAEDLRAQHQPVAEAGREAE